jgi:hypothetical protein
LDLKVNNKGEFISAKVIPIKQLGEGIPVYDSLKLAWKQIVELSKEDFPESNLYFDNNLNKIFKSK